MAEDLKDKDKDKAIDFLKKKEEKESEEVEYEVEEKEKEITFAKAKEKLKEKLKAYQKEKEQYLAGWQRERADFINYKRGEEERFMEFGILQKGKIILEFLAILESLEKAEGALKKISLHGLEKENAFQHWLKGVFEIKNQIKGILKIEKVEEIATNCKFDPRLHEVVEMVEGQDNQIIEVVQKGYLLCGKLLCPAKVKIGKKVENNK